MKKKYRLIIFDLDGTLADMKSDELYPEAAAWFAANPHQLWKIATNQGGIGLRFWMERDSFGTPRDYPNLEEFQARMAKLLPDLPASQLLMCARYQSKTSGKWSPAPSSQVNMAMWQQDWRKPAPGMLLHAMEVSGSKPKETLMVGDGPEDEQAAAAAGCDFAWAWDFFGRPVTPPLDQ